MTMTFTRSFQTTATLRGEGRERLPSGKEKKAEKRASLYNPLDRTVMGGER